MKKYLVTVTAIAVMSLTSCYVRVRESHPHPRGRIVIQTSDNTSPKDSLQAPVISEPAK